MTVLNRDLLGRRIQLVVYSRDYTTREWWDDAFKRRSRGYWPRYGPYPILYYWSLGPIDLRIWTAEAMHARAVA